MASRPRRTGVGSWTWAKAVRYRELERELAVAEEVGHAPPQGDLLDDLALNDDALDLAPGDHGGWAGHLLDRVRQKEELLASHFSDRIEDVPHPARILPWRGRSANAGVRARGRHEVWAGHRTSENRPLS